MRTAMAQAQCSAFVAGAPLRVSSFAPAALAVDATPASVAQRQRSARCARSRVRVRRSQPRMDAAPPASPAPDDGPEATEPAVSPPPADPSASGDMKTGNVAEEDVKRTVASAASSATSLNEALADCAARALSQLVPGAPPDVALVFVSARYAVSKVGPLRRESLADVAPCLRAFLPGLKAVFGCTTDGVIGDAVEIEDKPSVSLTLLRIPGVKLTTFHVMPDDVPSLDASQPEWRAVFGGLQSDGDENPPAFILLSDPAFAERGDLQRCLAGLAFAYPGSSVVGALASAGAGYAKGHLLCTLPRDVLGATVSSALRDNGMVGLAMTGDVEMDCIVSQSCRSIGPTFEVRKIADNNTVIEMEQVGRAASVLSALGHLKGVMQYATPVERILIEADLHVGFAPTEFNDDVRDEDMLVRHVIRVDPETGSMTLSCRVRPGQRLRFCINDDRNARALLDAALQRYKRAELAKTLVGYANAPLGALMFVDADRGVKLFGERGYESRQISNFVPGAPISGFFGAAQIGPAETTAATAAKTGPAPADPAVLHNVTSVVAFIRHRSAIAPTNPPASPEPGA